jgi:tyrosine-protein phosphatase non-receptor type 23
MRNQRESLVNQLRQQMKEDDILHMMVGETSDNRDSVIADHLKTHRDLADIIRQNLTAQDNILKALTEANAKQAKTRQGRQQLKKKREDWCVGLAKSAGSFNFLQSKIT